MALMHENLTERIIGTAIEVHRTLGPGLLESIYEECLCHELSLRELPFERQVSLALTYKDVTLQNACRADLVVDGKVALELKAVEHLLAVHEAQLLTYLRLGSYRVGLLINFNVPVLKDSLKRMVL